MTDTFPQTWYRPTGYGRDVLEELIVHAETPMMIAVEKFTIGGKPTIRKMFKSGSFKSKRAALEHMVSNADRALQRLNDERSSVMQRRMNALKQIAALPKEPQP